MTRSRDVATRGGLTAIIPSSVNVSSGTVSVSANGKITMAGVNSITVYDAFNANYDNYRITVNLTSATTSADPLMHIGPATLHYWRKIQNGSEITANNVSGWNFMRQTSTGGAVAAIDLMQPFVNTVTIGLSRFGDNELFTGYSSLIRTAESINYFGVTFTGVTGTLRVYGYNNG